MDDARIGVDMDALEHDRGRLAVAHVRHGESDHACSLRSPITDVLCRSRVPTGLVTKTLSTTCVARHPTPSLRFAISWPRSLNQFDSPPCSSSTSVFPSHEQRRARFINVLSVDSLLSLVKVVRHTDVLLPLTERVTPFSTLSMDSH